MSSGLKSTLAMRNGTIVTLALAAMPTSLCTACDLFTLSENTSTMTWADEIAAVICWPNGWPATWSRGAIQQRMPLASSP